MLKYRRPEDEIQMGRAAFAFAQEFGVKNLIFALPKEWEDCKNEIQKDFRCDFHYVTDDTVEIRVKGATAWHITQLEVCR